ncbi:MAG: M48 family metallopeptidase [Burkholderiales bacterium]|nr:M48 family metallopeptidase [Burkholderiales bacterium]
MSPVREVSEREITLEGEAVAYRLIRSRRRSIGIEIAYGGAVVRAPHWVRVGDIHSFLLENANWIRRKLESWRAARARVRPEDWRDGGIVRCEGQDLRLSVFPSRARVAAADLFDLRIGIPKPTPERIRDAVEEWLKDRAGASFPARVAACCARLGLAAPTVKLSNSRTQWGSCEHHRGRSLIRLQWRLIQLAPELADYIIAHEVSHLREMNHSPRFWATVAGLYPGYRDAEKRLRELAPLIEP